MVGLYFWTIPLGEAPDEPGHLQCIEQVVSLKRIPIVEPMPTGGWSERSTLLSGHMCYHMPLYYLVSGFFLRLVSAEKLTTQVPPNNPHYVYGTNQPMFDHTNRLSMSAEIVALRLFSVLLGALFIWATVQIAFILRPIHPNVGFLAGLLLAGWPQFLFMYRTISNDQLATTLAVLGLLTLLRKKPFLAALLFSFAVATKLTTLFTFGVLTISTLYLFWQERKRWLPLQLQLLITTLLTPLLLHPTTREHLSNSLYGFSSQTPAANTITYWGNVFVTSLNSGYARFGWMDISVPQWQVILFWSVILLCGAIGLSHWSPKPYSALIVFMWLAGVGYSYWSINNNRFQPQFRFAFAALPLIAFYAANGLIQFQKNPQSNRSAAVVIILGIAVNINLITRVILPIYTTTP